jgi:uncharacterized protein YehS (DUF1456 family)
LHSSLAYIVQEKETEKILQCLIVYQSGQMNDWLKKASLEDLKITLNGLIPFNVAKDEDISSMSSMVENEINNRKNQKVLVLNNK